MNSPDRTGGEKTLPEKVLALKGVFEQSEIPFAFGGAIALAYHAEPRATDDIDVNILLSPIRGEEVVRALEKISWSASASSTGLMTGSTSGASASFKVTSWTGRT